MDKIILHSDLNNFYASVECLLHPELRTLAVAVSGNPEKRHGIILAKNALAKSYGVSTGETIYEAQRKCPSLVCVPAHHNRYDEYSKIVKEIYYTFTDKIESFGLDECWLDVTGSTKLFGSGDEIAYKIKEKVKEVTGGLTVSIGVSFSKTLAKLGSDMKKPDAVTVIDRGNYKQLAWSIPVGELMYVGGATLIKLNNMSVKTIGDLANASDILLKANLGINGTKLKQVALGIDDDTVAVYKIKEPPKSVGHGTTTFKDMTDNQTIKTVLYSLSDMVASRLRRYKMYANGVSVGIRDSTLSFISRQATLPQSTQSGKLIADMAFELFCQHHKFPTALPVRSISVSTFSLSQERKTDQLGMFTSNNQTERPEKLEKTLDIIKERYGQSSITRAAYMQNEYVLDSFSDNDETLPFYRG